MLVQKEETERQELVSCQQVFLILCASKLFLACAVFGIDFDDLEVPGTPVYLNEW